MGALSPVGPLNHSGSAKRPNPTSQKAKPHKACKIHRASHAGPLSPPRVP